MLFKNIRTGKIIDVFDVTGDEWEPVNVSVPSPVSIDTKDDDPKKTKPKRKKAVK